MIASRQRLRVTLAQRDAARNRARVRTRATVLWFKDEIGKYKTREITMQADIDILRERLSQARHALEMCAAGES